MAYNTPPTHAEMEDPWDPLDAIQEERNRQQDPWTTKHDDRVEDAGQLVRGACAYALASIPDAGAAEAAWPWHPDNVPVRDDGKPGSRDAMSLLVKAGALILAEMERLHRATLDAESEAGFAALAREAREGDAGPYSP